MQVKVLNCTRYNFKDDSGRDVSGAKVTYLGEAAETDRFRGVEVITVAADEHIYAQLPKLPADVDLKISVTMRQGKAQARCMGIEQK